jgi:hypothetical protein
MKLICLFLTPKRSLDFALEAVREGLGSQLAGKELKREK